MPGTKRKGKNRHINDDDDASKKAKQKNGEEKGKGKVSISIPRTIADTVSLSLVTSPLGPIQTNAVSNLDKDIILERLKKEIVDAFGMSLSPPSSSTSSISSSSVRRQGIKRQKRIAGTTSKSITKDELEDGGREARARTLFKVAKSRLIFGTNSCTRFLSKIFASYSADNNDNDDNDKDSGKKCSPSKPKPALCILCRDVRPPHILSHIPYYCMLMDIPILLLPGKSSSELGQILGGKITSIMFLLDKERIEIDLDLDNNEKSTSKGEGEGEGADATTTTIQVQATKACAVAKRGNKQFDSFIEFAKSKLPDAS
mmetsp:Transcript_12443/g.18700  ORF Transcript_12443/g.18700 Transcript_12443/m.18700 type:complete len:315 (-) Transcript_12443:269-1213(-)